MATNGNLALTPRIITIDAIERQETAKLRVAVYARVSSSSEDQLNSFVSQNRYYTDLISSNPKWAMVDIYADEGITGTSAEKRPDFQRMLTDCRRGKIDRILVKSISRFARNTKDCLEVIRELKLLGISVAFEKEGIDTGRITGEMMTAVFASLAQEESRSISENVRRGIQMRMEMGTFVPSSVPFGFILKCKHIEVDESRATIIRMIYKSYLTGRNMAEIECAVKNWTKGTHMEDETASWDVSTIRCILMNETYAGNSVWQKKYMSDSYPPVKMRNYGERQMYYVKHTHQGIVSEEEFQAVQKLRMQRTRVVRDETRRSAFEGKIICGQCGSMFRKKAGERELFWSCRGHERNTDACKTTQISELKVQTVFLRLYYNLKNNSKSILSNYFTGLQVIRNRRMLWSMDVISLNKRISDLLSQNQMLAMLNKQGLIDPDIFILQSNELTEQIRSTKLEKERLMAADNDDTIDKTQELLDVLDSGPEFLDAFDADLFGELIDKIIVDSNTSLRFRLKNGLELREAMERTVR